MDPVTTPFERALHLLLFLSAGLALALVAVAVIERLFEGARRTIRPMYVVVPVLAFAALFVAERIYHTVH